MLYFHPGALYKFEIPDAWLQAAGAHAFRAQRACYVSQPDLLWPVTAVALQRVQMAPGMTPTFDEQRMVSVLRAMVRDTPLPALSCAPGADPAALVLCDGLHRYHAALALRFKQVPVACPPRFDL